MLPEPAPNGGHRRLGDVPEPSALAAVTSNQAATVERRLMLHDDELVLHAPITLPPTDAFHAFTVWVVGTPPSDPDEKRIVANELLRAPS